MENQESSVEIFERFTWKIENFSRLNGEKINSETFILGGYPWRILLFPKGNKIRDAVDHLSIYLEAVKTDNMSEGWSRRDVKFKLLVFNQHNPCMTIIKELEHNFNANEDDDFGFTYFMSLTELRENGFLEKDGFVVGAEVYVCKSSHEKQVDAELSYDTILGRVIILLQTNKVKDMNDKTCKELQVLWDQLQKSKLDLTWLEPQVQSALGMKSYVEKALEIEKLTENLVDSVLETVRLKEKLAAARVNLDRQRDLLKAKGVKEIDLDSQVWQP